MAGQFVKHFDNFLGISPDVICLTEEDSIMFENKVIEDEATTMV